MELVRGLYRNKETGEVVKLNDIAAWDEESDRSVAVYEITLFGITRCCFVKTFKEKFELHQSKLG